MWGTESLCSCIAQLGSLHLRLPALRTGFPPTLLAMLLASLVEHLWGNQGGASKHFGNSQVSRWRTVFQSHLSWPLGLGVLAFSPLLKEETMAHTGRPQCSCMGWGGWRSRLS